MWFFFSVFCCTLVNKHSYVSSCYVSNSFELYRCFLFKLPASILVAVSVCLYTCTMFSCYNSSGSLLILPFLHSPPFSMRTVFMSLISPLFMSVHVFSPLVSILPPSPTPRNQCFLQCYVTRSVLIGEAITGAVFNLIRQRCVGSPRGPQPQDVRGEHRGGKSSEAEKSSSLQHSIGPIKHNGMEPQSAALHTCCSSCSESIHESNTGLLGRWIRY